MKILQLRFKNLNSLYGEWLIDFRDSEYTANGIFVISGPTGAGKTTILDAICLGLYGHTPRLKSVGGSKNEIMSRYTVECFSEVVFVVGTETYRCYWEQHLAKHKIGGKLQSSKHEISRLKSDAEDELIADQKKEVAEEVEAKTGMNFDQFTRSMLLAQGHFDSFLQADEGEKADILEQITGTEIYTNISKHIFRRYRDIVEQKSLLGAELSGVELLTEIEEQDLEKNQTSLTQDQINLDQENKVLVDKIARLEEWQRLEEETRLIQEESLLQDEREATFTPKKERFLLAKKCKSLWGDYRVLQERRSAQSKNEGEFSEGQEKIITLSATLKSVSKEQEKVVIATTKAKEALKWGELTFEQVRLLDQKITTQQELLATERQTYEDWLVEFTQLEKGCQDRLASLSNFKNELEEVRKYLEQHKDDEGLDHHLELLKEWLPTLESKEKDLIESEEKISRAVIEWSNIFQLKNQGRSTTYEAVLKSLKSYSERQKSLLNGSDLDSLRANKAHLDQRLKALYKIANLDSRRPDLRPGKECPLCGSTSHPYLEGGQARSKSSELSETEEKIRGLDELIKEVEEVDKVVGAASVKQKEIDVLLAGQVKIKDEILSIEEKIISKIKIKRKATNLSEIVDQLTNRFEQWRKHKEQEQILKQKRFGLESGLEELQLSLEKEKKRGENIKENLKEQKKILAGFVEERRGLFGDKRVEEELAWLQKEEEDSRNEESIVGSRHNKVGQELNTFKELVARLGREIKEINRNLDGLEKGFLEKVNIIGLVSEKEYLAGCLGEEEMETLDCEIKALEQKTTELKVRKGKLAELKAKFEETEVNELGDLKVLKEAQAKLAEKLATLHQSLGAVREQLAINTQAKAKVESKRVEIEKVSREVSKWEKLNNLIGSADGKRYRTIAQGFTFEVMVAQANEQLKKMTDRYLLFRDIDDSSANPNPLGLNVMDLYQAGVMRPTKTLSGGESFLVSLSLALGLAEMSSKKIKVSSLFLDEGFGTLDENALDMALNTLSSLQSDGKLIGVISHVAALKERITTQIKVSSLVGGKSEVVGPGCKKIK